MPLLEVVPWASQEEWLRGKEYFASRDLLRAKELFKLWKCRTNRLPAGVETSLCLIEAEIAITNSTLEEDALILTLAAAINRFLNHISHVGLLLFGLSKFDEVARKFGIPSWLIEIRHETTHGQMMPIELMFSGLKFSHNWLLQNYWCYYEEGLDEDEPEEESSKEDTEQYENYRKLLDCYFYLKIYSIWGNANVSELKGQEELYRHISQMWTEIVTRQNSRSKKRAKRQQVSDIETLKINEAVHIMRSEFHRAISAEDNPKIIIEVLLGEELMFPNEEFLESLCEKPEDKSHLSSNLPPNLIKAWIDILKMLDSIDVIPMLIQELIRKTKKFDDKIHRKISCGWICEICRAIKNGSMREGEGEYNDLINETLNKEPDELTLIYLPFLLNLYFPAFSESKQQRIQNLIESFVICDSSISLGEFKSFVPKRNIRERHVDEKDYENWRLSYDYPWASLPIGICLNGELNLDDIPDKSELIKEKLTCPDTLHNIVKINWNTSDEASFQYPEETIPFYRKFK